MQLVLTVARAVKCLLSLRKASQLDVQIVSKRTDLREALVDEMEIGAETEEDLVETEDLIIEIAGQEKCTRQNVQTVVRIVKCRSSQQAKSQFIVEIVLINN